MAGTQTLFMFCLMTSVLQGASASKPEVVRVSLSPKNFQLTDQVLEGATDEQKSKLVDYFADQRLFRKRSAALDVLGEKLQEENDAFASEADHGKFGSLQQQTLNFMDYLEEINLLSAARDKLNAQKVELQSLGLDPKSVDQPPPSSSALAQDTVAVQSDSLAAALRDRKTLLEYYEGHRSFKKASEAIEGQGEKLSRSVAENQDFASGTEEQKLDLLQKGTNELLGFFAELKGLRSARDKLNAQKGDAAKVLQSFGVSEKPIPSSALAQLPDHVAFVTKTEGQKFDTLQKGTANLVGAFEQLKILKLEHDKLNAQKHDAVKMLQALGMSPNSIENLQFATTSSLTQVQGESAVSLKKSTEAFEAKGEKLASDALFDEEAFSSKSEDEKFDALETETAKVLDFFRDLKALKSKRDSLKAQSA